MQHLIYYVLLIVLLITSCQRQSAQSSDDRIRTAVKELMSDYQSYTASAGVDTIMTLYSNDTTFQWVEDGKIAYQSPREIEKGYRSLRKAYSDTRLELSNIKITPLPPDYANITAQFTQHMVDSAGNDFSFSGALTITAVKEQGSWKFLQGHTSSLKQH